ncbi:MAG: hypothetical protein SGILL_008122 [Bacillariaceae sp.]
MSSNNSNNAQNSGKTTLVNIKLYATGLKNVAGTFKGISDPYAVVTVLAGNSHEKPHVLGKTEVVKNSLKPDWITQFTTDYTFGKETKIMVNLFDEIRKKKHKPMGAATFELGEVLGSHGNVKAKFVKNGGTIFCRVTTAAEEDFGMLKLKFRAADLSLSGGGALASLTRGKVDSFFVLNAQTAHTGGNRVWHQEYRSEVIRDNAEPEWKPLEMPLERLCDGELDRAIQVEAYSWDKLGKHKLIGKFQTSVNGLLTAMAVPERGMEGMQLIHKSKPHGKFFVAQAEVAGGSGIPPSSPTGHMSSAPTAATTPLAPPSSLPVSNPGMEPLPTPLPPPMSPSLSSYPISASDSASSLPPAMPPPAFDIAEGPRVSSSVTGAKASDGTETFSLMPSPSPTSPKRAVSQRRPHFTDYLAGGLEISLSIAIDFTGSNGDPRVPGTLHHISRDGQLNDYEKVLTAVGRVLARYDSDQKFPVYGFGAKYNGNIKHCFQVGGASQLVGMKGVLAGYRSAFSSGLTMSGPTVFAEVIQHVAIQAQKEYERKEAMGKQSYSILLILTDGAVTDEDETKIALKYASSAPLSIVIVGLGNEDFSKMKFLDDVHHSDDEMRDIVKFVEFNMFRNDRLSLSEESLALIPSQVVSFFFDSKGIRPLPPSATNGRNVAADAYNAEEDIELDFDFGSDGSIQLADSRKATWNGSTYGDTSTFMTSVTQQANLFKSLTLSPGREKPKLTPYVSAPSNAPSMPQAAFSDETVVHVKVPPNAKAGMQLRVTNPNTGKSKVVAVPMGVPPGGTFPCRV